MLEDPVVAFVKAFCLRGDKDALMQAITESFDIAAVAEVKKKLWNTCKQDLLHTGLTFQSRRGCENTHSLLLT